MNSAPKLTVFISSPGDVNEERILAGRVIQRLNEEFYGVLELIPIFWEHEPMLMSETFQTQLPLPSESDIFICVMWSRIGTRLPANIRRSDGSRYDSGTEFEFEDAWTSFREKNKPALLIYKKSAEPPFLRNSKAPDFNLRLQQKEMLDSFFKKWFQDEEGSFIAAFNPFDDLAQFEERLELHLRKLIARQIPVGVLQAKTNVRWSKGSPFRGLNIFDTEHSAVFFGRTRAIGEIITALRRQAQDQQPFVMVLGMSGSGKSSLVRAGIIPLLTQAGVIEGVGLWKKVIFRPSNLSGDIALETAKLLMLGMPIEQENGETCKQAIENISEILKNSHFQELISVIQQRLQFIAQSQNLPENSSVKLLIVIDQMEEVFTATYFEQRVRETFFNILQQLSKSGLVWIISTFRSDFYHRCADIPSLVKMIQGNGQYLLTPPSTNEIAQIVRLPTLAAGLFFEKHPEINIGLDEVLIDEAIANSHNLALLQFILEQLYQHRREDGALTYQAYEMLGGLNGALAQRAEEVFNTCSPSAQAAFASLMRTLVTFGEDLEKAVSGKRWLTSGASREESELLEAFIQARLIVTDTIENVAIARITHECLLSHWPRLTNWIAQNQGLLRLRAHISDLASFWRGRGCSKELLLSDGKMLSDCKELLHEWSNALPSLLIEFIRQSLKIADQQRQATQEQQRKKLRHSRQLTTVFAILTVMIAITGYNVYLEREQARQQHQKMVALLAVHDTEGYKPTTGMQRSFEMLNKIHKDQQVTPAKLDLEQALYYGLSKTQQKTVFVGHQKTVTRIGISQDNQRVITSSEDGTAKLWRINGELISTLDHQGKEVNRSRFDHQGKLILTTCANDRVVRLWDGYDGRLIQKIDTYQDDVLNTDQSDITEARFDATDQFILTSHVDGKIKRFNLQGQRILSYVGHTAKVNGTWFNTEEKQMVSFSDDHSIQVWDIESGKKLFKWTAEAKVHTAAFSYDGQLVAAGDDKGNIYLWSLVTGELYHTFKAKDKRRAQIVHLTFQPIANNEVAKGLILSASYDDHSVWLWNIQTKDIEYIFTQLGEVAKHSAFSPDGRYLMASSDSFIRVWDVEKGQLIHKLGGHNGDIIYSTYGNNGNWIVSAGSDNTARLWWLDQTVDPTFKVIHTAHSTEVKKITFGYKGEYLLSISKGYTAKIRNTRTGDLLYSFDDAAIKVTDALLSPNGERLAIAYYNRFTNDGRTVVNIWDTTKVNRWNPPPPELTRLTFEHRANVQLLSFSVDNQSLLTNVSLDDEQRDSTGNGYIKLWNLTTGDSHVLKKNNHDPNWAGFTPNGIVTTTDKGEVALWRTTSQDTTFVSPLTMSNQRILHADTSPNHQYLALALENHMVQLWSLKDEQPKLINIFQGHSEEITHLVFSPDNRKLLTSSKDKTAQLWNVQDGQLLQTLRGHLNEVTYATFSPDTRFIATASQDHTARVWRFNGQVFENAMILRGHLGRVTYITFHPSQPIVATASADQTIRFWALFNDSQTLIQRAEQILPQHIPPL
jgi:WD40 repeat protein